MGHHRLGDLLAKVKRPGKVPKDEYLEAGSFPIIDQSQIPIAGFTNNPEVVIKSPLPLTVFGDHTRAVKLAKEPFACSADGTQLLYPVTEKVDPTFFYYAVTNINLSNYYYARHFKFLKEQKINVPPLPTQHRIASILSAYDDLIENNRRRIKLLEQAARLLYKEWFVHLRFPGHEHVKITDGIPEGWEKKSLSDVADITMGQSPKSVHYNQDEDGLPFHQGVTDFGSRFPKHKTYCKVKNRTAEQDDILFSVRAPVGWINTALDKMVIGRGLAAIQSKLNQQNLLFYALKSHFFREDLMGGGSIFAAVTKKDLYNVVLALPSGPVARTFSEQVKPMDEQIKNLHISNTALTKARDLLPPRLMNGSLIYDYEQDHICDSRPKVTEATA